jgi:hypothetical protein
MATVLFNTSEVSPIPYYTNDHLPIHNPNGVDPLILKEALWVHLVSLEKSYNSVKFNWDNYYEGELMESLTIHSYDADLWERYGRKFDQTKLVDLLELPLKNTNNYIQAIQSFIEYVLWNLFVMIKLLTIIIFLKITRNNKLLKTIHHSYSCSFSRTIVH